MKLSCALVTNVDSPELIAEAERLGYQRAWLYDSPAITSDVWMALALAAERTSTIGLGPGVLVPSLRHPMTNAAAIATLAAIAPGRVAVAIGSGFTGRYILGKRPLRWAVVEEYVMALRALLRGETVQWEGAPIRMLHTDGFVADRPVDVEVLIGADGPKGTAVAERVGDGVFAAGVPNPAAAGRPYSLLQFGTVLDDGEDVHSEQVIDRAGHGLAVVFHALYERNGADAVAAFPGGSRMGGRDRGHSARRAPPRHPRRSPGAAHRGRRGGGRAGGRPATAVHLQRDVGAVARIGSPSTRPEESPNSCISPPAPTSPVSSPA